MKRAVAPAAWAMRVPPSSRLAYAFSVGPIARPSSRPIPNRSPIWSGVASSLRRPPPITNVSTIAAIHAPIAQPPDRSRPI